MKKNISLVIAMLLFVSIGWSQKVQYKKVSIAKGRAEIELPASFGEQKNANVSDTGKTSCETQCVFYDRNNTVWLNYDYSSDSASVPVTDNDVPLWADKQLALLKQNARFKYIDDGIYLQNWKNISYIKFISKQNEGADRYHMLFLTNMDNKIILFHFSCLKKQRKKWEPIADSIANSLRIKE